MRSARTVCFVFFVIVYGTHADVNSTNTASSNETTASNNPTIGQILKSTPQKSNPDCACSPSSTTPPEGACIFYMPSDNTLILVLVAFVGACFILLLTTLICACQLCHMKVMISRFKPHHNNIDLQAMRKRSQSPCGVDGQAVRDPTETCIMLSEDTTHEEENKEESVPPNNQPHVEGPNGEVAQEDGKGCEAASKEPGIKAPESSAIEV